MTNHPLRILIHSLVFSPDRNSTAYLMTDLAIELKRLGHTITVLTTTPHYGVDQERLRNQPLDRRWGGLVYYSELDGISVWHVKLPMKRNRVLRRAIDYVRFHLISLLLCIRTINSQNVVLATSPPLTIGIVSWLLAKRWRAAPIYRLAEIYPDLAIEQGVVRGRFLIALLKMVEQFVYQKNTAIVAIAKQFEELLRKRGVPDEKIRMIPDFVDTDFFRPLRSDRSFTRLAGVPDSDFVVLYAGNIGLVQDWQSVLDAAGLLQSHPISFLIVGDGARREWLSDEVRRRNLQKIRFLEYQPKEMMPKLYAECDVGLIPMTRSGAAGGFPSKLYTILACGRPVVVTGDRDCEMITMLRDARCGRRAPLEDGPGLAKTLLAALSDKHELREEGRRGRILAEGFSKKRIAESYQSLFNELCA